MNSEGNVWCATQDEIDAGLLGLPYISSLPIRLSFDSWYPKTIPEIGNPKPQTRNTKHQTRITNHGTRNTKPENDHSQKCKCETANAN